MATVYLATDLKHEREVALKVLKPELAAVLGAERFLAEVKITARLHHPHILTLIDSGEAGGQLYYVLPYVRGDSLRARLDRERQLGLEESLRITRQIASALDYAHQQGVIHRDIKPENILFHEGEAMLADFGIALAVKQAGGKRLTETGLSLGTPQYMSPEQATGDRQLDARSDVYSLGAVLYEMLAGEPPVTGPTVQAIIAKLLTERPTRLRVVRDTIPEGVDAAVMKALAKVPSDRYASAGELSAALDRSMEPGRAVLRPRRPGWLLPLGVATVAVAAAAALVLTRARGGAAAPVATPVRTQVTVTGNANAASISPDGSRIAYASKQCDADRRCTYDVVVQDLGGAGTLAVMHGATSVRSTEWSPDGRYLLVLGSRAPKWGAYVVPATVQGVDRYIGCCDANFLGGSDTLLLNPLSQLGDTVRFLTIVTPADGVRRDSILVRGRFYARSLRPRPSPDGRQLAVGRRTGSGAQLYLLGRDGGFRDSLELEGLKVFAWMPDGRGLLLAVPEEGRGLATLELERVDADAGHFVGSPRTVIAGVELGMEGAFDLTRDGGTLQYSSGSPTWRVTALTRTGPTPVSFAARVLRSGTARLAGTVSPNGATATLETEIAVGSATEFRFSLIPFDSGPESVVLPQTNDLYDRAWVGRGDAGIIYCVAERGTFRYFKYDPASGRSGPLFALPDSLGRYSFVALPDGRFVVATDRRLVVLARNGAVERSFDAPPDIYRVDGLRSSALHDDILLAGPSPSQDSLVVVRFNPNDGQSRRAGVFVGENIRGMQLLDDGSIQVAVEETIGTTSLYVIPAAGGPPRRLGLLPYQSTDYSFSGDGRHVVASSFENHADVWLIKNLKDLLPKP